jgi:RHS repeat-associated protein
MFEHAHLKLRKREGLCGNGEAHGGIGGRHAGLRRQVRGTRWRGACGGVSHPGVVAGLGRRRDGEELVKRSTVWGITARNRDARAQTPLRFPGRYADPETGLHYSLNRHYDPETARYLSADPLGLVPAPDPAAYVVNPCTWMDPEGLVAKGCRQIGGRYGGLLPSNRMADGKKCPQAMEVNHIPAKSAYKDVSEPGFCIANKPHKKQKVNNGPAIRVEQADHEKLYSTGYSPHSQAWQQYQRELIDQGRITEAMRMGIDDIKRRFPGKYDQHIKDMVAGLKDNKPLQEMLKKRGWSIDTNALPA